MGWNHLRRANITSIIHGLGSDSLDLLNQKMVGMIQLTWWHPLVILAAAKGRIKVLSYFFSGKKLGGNYNWRQSYVGCWAWSTEKSWGPGSCSFSWRICSHTVSLRFNFDDVSFFFGYDFFPCFFVFRLDSSCVLFFHSVHSSHLSTLTQDADVAWYLAADTTEVLTSKGMLSCWEGFLGQLGGLPWPKRASKIEVHIPYGCFQK